MKPFTTLPGMARYVLNTYRSSCAFNYREDGVWKALSTEAFMEEVRRLALGLYALGVQRGQSVGILAESSPFWVIADLAIQIAGGTVVPIFTRISDENFEFQVNDAKIDVLFVFGEEQWQVLSRSSEELSHVITKDISCASCPGAKTLEQVMELGDRTSEEDPGLYSRLLERITEEDLATLIYTSGSTGVPKGVELTQANLVSQLHAAQLRFPVDPSEDIALSCLPLAHIFERTVMYYYLSFGVPVFFADDLKKLGQLITELRPTMVAVVPRILEKIYAKIVHGARAGGFVKQKVGEWAIDVAKHSSSGLVAAAEHAVADHLVFSQVREKLGGRMRGVICGGAALDADLCRFFLGVGVPVYQGYGLTETSPIIAGNYLGHNKPGTVGPPFPGVEVKITEEGEICSRSSSVMRGYRNQPKITAEVIDEEGWFHTGDCGHFDSDGHLVVTGRIKEILKTSNGKQVTPIPIEQAICRHPLIDLAMVIAEGKRFVSVLLFPDFDVVKQMKHDLGNSSMSHEEFLDSEHVREQIGSLINQVNTGLNHWEQVRKYAFVPHPVSVEGGELTPTLKVRRLVVAGKYAELINQMYAEAGELV